MPNELTIAPRIGLTLSLVALTLSLGGCADTECPTYRPAFSVELEGIALEDIDALLTDATGELVEIACEATNDADVVRCNIPLGVRRDSTLRLQLDLTDGRSLGFEKQLGGECHAEPNPLRIRVPE